jgi:dTMP kinase
MEPLFIVFEGIDGSGTSTQARLLSDQLEQTLRQRVRLTSEPSLGPVGQIIRMAMSGRMSFSSDARAFDHQMAYLFAADRYDHLYNDTNGVLKLRSEGFFVISTRYYFSSLAYHCETDDDFELVKALNARFPLPDLTIYLDISPEESMLRLSRRSNLDKYENVQKLAFVRRNYEAIFSDYKGRLLRVAGHKPEQSIHSDVLAAVRRLANHG